MAGGLRLKLCWVMAALWLVLTLWTAAAGPQTSAASVAVLPSLLFMGLILIHGSLSYGWKGIGLYFAIGVLAGFVLEASSIATGFPFGLYKHNVPGPRLLDVPIPTILAYAVLGAPSWMLARLIVRRDPSRSQGSDIWTTPIIGAFIMTGMDFAFDPIGHTVRHQWTFAHPSGQFGVPLSNFLGWLLIGWIIFQLFALVERRFTATAAVRNGGYWLLPCILWLGSAIQFPFLFAQAPAGITRVGDRAFVIADVYEAGLIAAIMTVIFTGLLGLMRLVSDPPRSWPSP